MSKNVIRDPSRQVTIRTVSRRPLVVRFSCSCNGFCEDVGEPVFGLELWEGHAAQAGHEGEFGVIVDG